MSGARRRGRRAFVGFVQEPLGERLVAGDAARLQQRLELPRLRPAVPVRGVRAERAAERAGAAFGPQVGVGAEHDAVGRLVAHRAQQRLRRPLGVACVAVVDEHHVDVARVVELATAELAHADDGHRHVGLGDLERDAEARLREGGELETGRAQVGHAEQVARRDAHERTPLAAPELGRRIVGVGHSGEQRLVVAFGRRRLECSPVGDHRHRVAIVDQRREERVRRGGDRDDRVEQDAAGRERVGPSRVAPRARRSTPARAAGVGRALDRPSYRRRVGHRRSRHGPSVA